MVRSPSRDQAGANHPGAVVVVTVVVVVVVGGGGSTSTRIVARSSAWNGSTTSTSNRYVVGVVTTGAVITRLRPSSVTPSAGGTSRSETTSASPSGSKAASGTVVTDPPCTVICWSSACGGRFTRTVTVAGAETCPAPSTIVYWNVAMPVPPLGSNRTLSWPTSVMVATVPSSNVAVSGSAWMRIVSPSGSTSLSSGRNVMVPPLASMLSGLAIGGRSITSMVTGT